MLDSLVHVVAAQATSYGLTQGRITALVGVASGLTAAIVGVIAVRSPRRRRAITALVLGLIAAGIGSLVVLTAAGGLGTGNGWGGGVVALVVGSIGMILGAVGLARSRIRSSAAVPSSRRASRS